MSDSENCISKEKLLGLSYTLSHIIVASILVICLKNNKRILLAILLFSMLGFVSYTEQETIPIYSLLMLGTFIYMIDIYIINRQTEPEIISVISGSEPSNRVSEPEIISSSTTLNEAVKPQRQQSSFFDTIWKIPYWGILIYYENLILTTLK